MGKHGAGEGQKFNRNRFLLWAMVASFFTIALVFTLPGVAIYEWNVADVWARQNYPRHVAEKVAVVGIDDNLFRFGKYDWPLEKDVYGELIMYLQEMGAKVVAFDIEFSHNFQQCGASDSLFLGMVGSSPDVVIGYGFVVEPVTKDFLLHSAKSAGDKQARDTIILDQIDSRFAIGKGEVPLRGFEVRSAEVPYPSLRQNMSSCGFFNRTKPMFDGVDRFMPLIIEQDSLLFASLALSSVQRYLGGTAHFDAFSKRLNIGTHSWSVSPQTNIALNFTDSIPVYPMSDIMVSFQDYLLGKDPEIGKKQLSGKIIFIGVMGHSSGDLGINPVSTKKDASFNYNGQTPMVMLHAYTANSLLENHEIYVVERWGSLLLSLMLVFVMYLLFRRVPQNVLNIIIPILLAVVYAGAFILYRSNIFFPVVEALSASVLFSVAGIFINYYDSNHEFRYISSLFKTYISPELIEEMAKNHTVPKLGGELINGTAFFTDIEKFSTFSEIFTPEELIQVLNEYFSQMTEILKKNKGTLDKFIGDAIVAIFGAPLYYPENAEHACMAAWNMQEALAGLREKWRNDPALREKIGNMHMRIGINSGEFIVGHLGCEDRKNYTMIGDTVNLAARLESGAKQYGVYTLVGESTYESAKKSFLFRAVDRIVVVGRKEPVSIYELIGPRDAATPAMVKCVETYEIAMSHYIAGDFSAALECFSESLKFELTPEVKTPSAVMVERCRELVLHRPDVWDGVYRMSSK